MIPFVLAFLLGDIYLQYFAEIPSIKTQLLVLMVAAALAYQWWQQTFVRMIFAFVLGFVFTAWYAQFVLDWKLPKPMENVAVLATGYIKSIPTEEKYKSSFIFHLQKLQLHQHEQPANVDIKLSAYASKKMPVLPHFKVGDQWTLLVRIKRIKAIQSPGAFDYEAWALQKGLRATGTILPSDLNHKQTHTWHSCINQVRQSIYSNLKAYLPHSETAHWLLALTVGERNDIAQAQWQILRSTGTNHLMAIAGLHIGIVAGFAHKLVALLWRLRPLWALTIPVQLASAWSALIVAVLYSALAGFSLPTQRASIMLAIFIFTVLRKQKINTWQSYCLALLIVLLLNPLNVLTESFWLSFGTIALIIFAMHGRYQQTGLWWKWGRVQWVIGFGLIPFSIFFFQEFSLTSFLANSIAIPWLAIAILPLCLLSLFFLFLLPKGVVCLLWLADKSLAALWKLLSLLSDLKISAWHLAMPKPLVLITTMIAFVFFLLPRHTPLKCLGFLWLLPLFFPYANQPNQGEFWFAVLDVGQGLSVVVRTAKHVLVYDTGAKYLSGLDMGESVISPYLLANDIRKINMLVISHGDNDHMGGAQALMSHFDVRKIKTSVPQKLISQLRSARTFSASHCLIGQSWQWDQIQFSFLYPSQSELGLGNNSSCVLKIENEKFSLLLTGDIEKAAEKRLLLQSYSKLSSTMMTAPHHGSKTSSTIGLINAVQPQHVFYSTGYLNRYHMPDPTVQSLYRQRQVIQHNTETAGTIEVQLDTRQNAKILAQRQRYKRYWMVE